MDVDAIGERLRGMRGDRSREDVVRSIEQNQGYRMIGQYLYLLEHGKVANPGIKAIDALAREYETTSEYILYGHTTSRRASGKR